MAVRKPDGTQPLVKNHELTAMSYELNSNHVVGILPLIHLKHFLFDNSLISIPFFDLGGILADDEETEKALLFEAIRLGQDLAVNTIELRHVEPLSWLNQNLITDDLLDLDSSVRQRRIGISHSHPRLPRLSESDGGQEETEKSQQSMQSGLPRSSGRWYWGKSCPEIHAATKSHKVRMLLELPESSEILMKSFKAKLRSQIKKPIKEGLQSKIGGSELLDDFYHVFLINMRDLGSPVHSKNLMKNVLEEFPETSRLVIVYRGDDPVACSMVVGFKNILENPWASALREYSRLSPNMLLYWAMLEYACDNGFNYSDFGRSSPDEGTYKFKKQWGAQPSLLHWHYFALDGKTRYEETSEKSKFDRAIHLWQKIPVPITKIIGPMIRKHIGL